MLFQQPLLISSDLFRVVIYIPHHHIFCAAIFVVGFSAFNFQLEHQQVLRPSMIDLGYMWQGQSDLNTPPTVLETATLAN